jgi:ABC-type amino acid transport substrate-binding protein
MAFIPAKVWTPLTYVMILGLLLGVYFLPADTSLREVGKAGQLRACMPPLYPPLVTGDTNAPGIDVELLRALAGKLGLQLATSLNPAMGQDFNPRNWRLTRAQCEVLAGGVVASPVTRSFLETSPAYAETGWAFILPKPIGEMDGKKAGVLAGISGLDRIALARFLRARNVNVTIATSSADLTSGLRDGRFDFGVTEALAAQQMAAQGGWTTQWAPAELPRFPVVLGLWKGDLTLKRAIVDGLAKLEQEGEIGKIMARYRAGALKG